nr:hypothetical protein CFP56_65554 [Quercus suber]
MHSESTYTVLRHSGGDIPLVADQLIESRDSDSHVVPDVEKILTSWSILNPFPSTTSLEVFQRVDLKIATYLLVLPISLFYGWPLTPQLPLYHSGLSEPLHPAVPRKHPSMDQNWLLSSSTIGAGTSVRSSSYVQHDEMSAAGYHGVCCPTREVPNTLLARAPLDLIQPLSLRCYAKHIDGIRRSADLRTNGVDRICIAWPSLDDLGSVVLIRAHYVDDPEVSNFGDR